MIREAGLLACDENGNAQVSFRYRDSQRGETKVRTLHGADFLYLLLQDVLPNVELTGLARLYARGPLERRVGGRLAVE